MSRFWKITLIVIAVIVVAAIGFRLLHKPAGTAGAHNRGGTKDASGTTGQDTAPVPVTVQPVVSQSVPIYLTGLGTV